jgi:hypothetical protein
MSLKRLLIAVLVALNAFVGTGSAQQKNEISGLIGKTFIHDSIIKGATFFDNSVNYGNGISVEANYSRHVWGEGFTGLSLEVPVVINRDEDLNTGQNLIPKEYSSFFVTPAARLNVFAENAISPWFSFGGGFGHFGPSSTLLFGGTNPGKGSSTTGVLQTGFGLDVKFTERLKARLAVRDLWAGVPNLNVDIGKTRQHNLFVGGGIVWSF